MSSLQPFRQQLTAVSQSATAIVELTQRFELQSFQHPLWSFEHLLEHIAQDGFDSVLEQSQNDQILYAALLKSRHHYRSEADLARWVVGWRNQCFLDGRVEVVIASDAWLLKQNHAHLARINRPMNHLMHRWALSLDRGECTAISTSIGQLRIGFSEGTILCLDLETGAILQELQVRGAVHALHGFEHGLFYSTGYQTVCWSDGLLWSAPGAVASVIDPSESHVFLAMSEGTIFAFQMSDGFCLAQLKSNLQVAELVCTPEHLYVRTKNGRLWRVNNPVTSSGPTEWVELNAPILELISIERQGPFLMAADALGGLAFWDFKMEVWTQLKIPLPEGLKSVFWAGHKTILAPKCRTGVGNPVAQGCREYVTSRWENR